MVRKKFCFDVRTSPNIEAMTYSDASNVAWGGYAVKLAGRTAVGSWTANERRQSSAF